MKLTFWGAAQTVTGSMHLVEAGGANYLLDCGTYQGRRREARERNANLPFPARSVRAVVLSHAHIDHSGNLPSLVKNGFDGPIWTSPATADLCEPMLLDSAHIQEKDAEFVNKHAWRKKALLGTDSKEAVEPVYSTPDVEKLLPLMRRVLLHMPTEIGEGVTYESFDAGTADLMLSGEFYPVHQMMADYDITIDWDDYFPAIANYYSASNGDFFSMPYNSSTPVYYYNIDHFTDAGLTEGPLTWEGMEAAFNALKAAGHDCPMAYAPSSWIDLEQFSMVHNIPVASNDNGAVDGRNARLEYSIPVDAGGAYRTVVRATSSAGNYHVAVSGATGSGPAFAMASISPVTGALETAFPDTYRVTFNQDLLLTSIQADDLRINGIVASDVTIFDGRTLEFHVASTNTGDGIYTATIAPGSITSVTGENLPFFSATFDVDATNPVVVASNVAEGAVLDPGDHVYQVQFSEELATSNLGAEDIQLVRTDTSTIISVGTFAYDAPTSTLTLTFAALDEGSYELRLTSEVDGFRDRRNNLLDGGPSSPFPSGDGAAGDDFVLNFTVDTGTRDQWSMQF